MNKYYSLQFAQTYGTGAYGSCAYADATSCSSATTGTTSSNAGTSGGTLANTGFMVVVIVTLACLLIFAALIVRFWRRPRKTAEAIEVDEDEEAGDDGLDQR